MIRPNMKTAERLDKMALEIKRSEAFLKTVETVSEYIQTLPLSREENDKLVGLMLENVLAAERSGLDFGLGFAVDVLNYVKEERKNEG